MKRNLYKSFCAMCVHARVFSTAACWEESDENRIELSFSKRNTKFPPRGKIEGLRR